MMMIFGIIKNEMKLILFLKKYKNQINKLIIAMEMIKLKIQIKMKKKNIKINRKL
jgi:hypothetical protein